MEGLSFWSVQALQNLGSDGPLQVKYFRSSEEVFRSLHHTVLSNSDDDELNFCGGRLKYSSNPDKLPGWTAEPNKHKAKPLKGEGKPKGGGGGGNKKAKEESKKGEGGGGGGGGGNQKQGDMKPQFILGTSGPTSKKSDSNAYFRFIYDDQKDPIGIIESIETFLHKFRMFVEGHVHNPNQPISVKPEASGGKHVIHKGHGHLLPPHVKKYAVVYGETATEFNPSGIWVVEEFYNNDDV